MTRMLLLLLLLFTSVAVSVSAFQPLPCRTITSMTTTKTRMDRICVSADDDADETIIRDYAAKVREVERAVAAAETARKKLIAASSSQQEDGHEKTSTTVVRRSLSRSLPPPNSLATIHYSDAGTMTIRIPSQGFGANSFVTGAFSLAWFSAIIPATLASAGAASLLFMLPFWAAGGMVAKSGWVDPFVSGTVVLGKYAWSVENTYLGKRINQKEGPTELLRGATAETIAVVNGKPQAELQLFTKNNGMTAAFGLGLSVEELEYLSDTINDHLNTSIRDDNNDDDDRYDDDVRI